MLDSIGERYGLLPSEVLSRGNTLDVWVFDVVSTYRAYKQAEQSKDQKAIAKFTDKGDLEEQFKRFKEGNAIGNRQKRSS